MKTFDSIKRPSVVEEIIAEFKQRLLTGELQPGDKLPSEPQLMEQFGVGRTALREAMKMMSALGVIDVRQGDGSYVVEEPTSASMDPLVFAVLLEAGMNQDLLELRTLLEVGYCQLAAKKATPADFELIEKAAETFEILLEDPKKDLNRLTQADLAFHYSIMQATKNPLVIRISRTVEELFFSSISNTISRIEGQRWGVEGHRRIIHAIRDDDPAEIQQAVEVSLERWSRDLGSEEKERKKSSASI